MTSKVIKGFRLKPKQDGSAKVTLERVPYWGLDSSAKQGVKNRNRNPKRRKSKPIAGAFAGLFSPVKK